VASSALSASVRELDVQGAGELDGIWIANGVGDRLAVPPTPLTLDLVLQDSVLLGAAFGERGVSLPRLTKRVARISGHVYHAALPLIRAVRTIAPLDAELASLAFAAEARSEVGQLLPARASVSRSKLGRIAAQLRAKLRLLEQRALERESAGSQHYRWLVEMDLGILPDDALGTTLDECIAIERRSRALEVEVALEWLAAYAALGALIGRAGEPELGRALAALVAPDALEFAGATPAIALASEAIALSRERAPKARLSAGTERFLQGFGERGPNERELSSPRWHEQRANIERLLWLTSTRGASAAEERMAAARHEQRATQERIAAALGRTDRTLLVTFTTLARALAKLRSRLHLVRARTLSMLRTAVLDIDRRLGRLVGASIFLELHELRTATALPDPELVRRSNERRRAWTAVARDPSPPVLLGRASPANGAEKGTSPLVLASHDITGPATVARRFEDALALAPGGVLVVRSLDAGWAPMLPAAAAIVTETGGLADEGALVALSLGVPLVIGARDALGQIQPGETLQIRASAGELLRA
jgi:phosphohistidine swiveling domain-containing protein